MLLPLGLLLVGAAVQAVNGQATTNATCSSSFDWAFNSIGQSPCQVAAYLGSACDGGIFTVPALRDDTSFYTGPTMIQQNGCSCSTVFYSALSACADCQGGKVLPLEDFNANCSTVYTVFPEDIPDQTRVPHWAYQTIPNGGGFNATLAQLQLNAPESTASPTASSTSTSSVPSNTGSSSKKSKAGPIAGGVVGGTIFVLLCIIAVFWFLRRRRRGNAPSNIVGVPMGYHSAGNSTVTPFTSAIQMPKLYDPADPSTFPSHFNSSRVHSPATSGGTMAEVTNSSTTMHRPQYSGAAEV
ncbi:hypothetical protein HMN09_00094500 [Mycena chlorophos]|uniref:Uncharacterized protein n=1 Tax=Mycena chlorophos TaxID=658473 RepID=A0A8H6TUT9_MYCCL|nr:hypothetical protein HMN09_00094500 [Mycena chlorophos]